MVRQQAKQVIIVGAGAAGLMAARELGRGGHKVTILEAQPRCGGRIHPLPSADFGYAAEGGAEFIHGEAPVTRALMREAGLSLAPADGTQWTLRAGKLSNRARDTFDAPGLHQALHDLKDDLPLAEFLRQHFAGPEHARLRYAIERMVEGYDAADPERISTFAIRDEWIDGRHSTGGRVKGGYGRLIDFLVARSRDYGADIRLGAVVTAIEATDGGVQGGVQVRCSNGETFAGDAAILTVPIPLLPTIAVPASIQPAITEAAGRGFGNVIKLLLRFEQPWWADNPQFRDLTFLISEDRSHTFPVWWTQFPDEHAVLTGWLGGPKTAALAHLDDDQIIAAGLASLADIFELPVGKLKEQLVSAQVMDWSRHPFARGAYSYAVPEAHDNDGARANEDADPVYLAGEALYRGKDMGTVEAALASGLQAARRILTA